jgi:CubicO group peptidase (beta-lactamase class C family)
VKPLLIGSLVLLLAAVAPAANPLPRSAPEAQGVSSAAVLAFVEAADQKVDVMNSFMLVRHGHVVAEGWWTPYDAKTRHELYSLSKSFTSTAVGLAAADGKLSIDDPVLKFFPDDAPKEPTANLRNMRVRDLLCMSTGHQTEPSLNPTVKDPWTKVFLAHTVPFKPGTHFLYNTPATYMQSAIVQKVTGQTVLDYLKPRLFDPLGIDDPTWGTSPQGVSLGGYGLNVRTEDIAKFGQLYLQKGKWGDKQLVPAEWVAMATAKQTSNGSNPKSDWDQGYGFQFWRSRNGAYRGDGAFGQYCIVLPEQDAVIAITSGTGNMQRVLDLVWDILLPGLKKEALPADETGAKKLKDKLAGLSVPLPKADKNARIPREAVKADYTFAANDQKVESLSLAFDDQDGVILDGIINGTACHLHVGKEEWERGAWAFGTGPKQPVATSGAWTADDTYTAKIVLYETPFIVTATFKFADGKLEYETKRNVGFGATNSPKLVGEKK